MELSLYGHSSPMTHLPKKPSFFSKIALKLTGERLINVNEHSYLKYKAYQRLFKFSFS